MDGVEKSTDTLKFCEISVSSFSMPLASIFSDRFVSSLLNRQSLSFRKTHLSVRKQEFSIIILDSRNNGNKGNISVTDNPGLDPRRFGSRCISL